MAWKNRREVDAANQHLSNIYRSRGRLDGLGAYLCAGGIPASFMISGGADPDEKYEPLYQFLDAFIGRYPMIVIHNNDVHMEALVAQTWQDAGVGDSAPLWVVNHRNPEFEPFAAMSDTQVVTVMRQLANKHLFDLSSAEAPERDRKLRNSDESAWKEAKIVRCRSSAHPFTSGETAGYHLSGDH